MSDYGLAQLTSISVVLHVPLALHALPFQQDGMAVFEKKTVVYVMIWSVQTVQILVQQRRAIHV